MAPITLHYFVGSMPSRRVEIVLREMNLPFTEKTTAGDQLKDPAYIAMNPRSQVPTLTHGERVITESMAIIRYLEEEFPEEAKAIHAFDGEMKYMVYRRWMEGSVLMATSRNAMFMKWFNKIKAPADEERFAQNCKLLKAELDLWESYMVDDFVVGKTFTIADAAVAPQLTQLKWAGVDLAKWPKLNSYVDRMEARPSFVASKPPAYAKEQQDWLAQV